MQNPAEGTMVNMPGSQLSSAIERLQVHDHVCLIYETQEEQLAAVVPYIKVGLERGEKCIYILDDNTRDWIVEALRSGGIDVDPALNSGALTPLNKQETYLKHGIFDPDQTIEHFREATSRAKQEGYSALRVTGEMTWVLGGELGADRLMEYVSDLNYFFSDNEVIALCQYNRRRFGPEEIMGVIYTHPMLISGGVLCRNYYYVPPEEYLNPGQPALQVDRLIRNIVEHEKTAELLRESEERFRILADTAPVII
jgi:KaiC/GvpD/RAD55 family RecA-like ATPase